MFGRAIQLQRGFLDMLIVSLAFFPVPYCLLTGQDTFVTLLLFASALLFLKNDRCFWAGAALGLGVFKFQLILPIIGIFFLRRFWRLISGFACSTALVFALSTAMIGVNGMRALFRLWVQGENGTIPCINPHTMTNLRGLLASQGGLSSRSLSLWTVGISAVLLIVITYATRTNQALKYFASTVLCFVILVSFHTNLYDLAILVFPCLALLNARPASTAGRIAQGATVFLLFCSPLYVVALLHFRLPLLTLLVILLWLTLAIRLAHRGETACIDSDAGEPVAVRP